MNPEIVPLYFALPLLSLTAAALAIHWTMKLRAATLQAPRTSSRQLGLDRRQ